MKYGVNEDGTPIDKVKIRTILTCRSKDGICVKCYGANMASGEAVQVGESVGIIAAQSIGVAQGCLDEAIKYAKERKQFGRPIAKFQAISFMIADMATKLAAAKELVYNAAVLKDRNDPQAGMYCSMAKLFASEVCNEIAGQAVQIHGGYGFTKDYKVERFYRDCRVFTIYEGTSQVQQMVISGQLLK